MERLIKLTCEGLALGHIRLSAYIFILLIPAAFAQAAPVVYRSNTIATYLSLNPEDFSLTETDLNDDGLNEFIVRETACNEGFCRFHILAQTEKGLASLLESTARSISLGPGYTNGVRDLHVFADTQNDYSYQNYVWSPTLSRYTEESGEE